ncbi:hypothetical protein L226DRAFT_162611 [Lentinus tigrinus ALCF2SS1-7]|uniref:uncharacterized protein n=1 Tax=Lentinus tigrinus ALCF2SS1-7 TaxID=1328758 RepID=UPI001165E018|nr:hypothetical protein L226DRAFT_162611 [Lentinus tigrinus ALCF2SS1-7]
MPPNPVPAAMEIRIPVEVDNNWHGILKRAWTYALAQVSAAPLRLFSLVIGVNHKTRRLRFLIYHRGGLTASHEIDLHQARGRRDVQRVMFSILLWQNSEDAGLPSFTNGFESLIPSKDTTSPVRVVTDKVLFHSLSVRGRGTLVVRAVPKSPARPSFIPVYQVVPTRRTLPNRCRPKSEPIKATYGKTTAVPVSTIQSKKYHDKLLRYVPPPDIIGSSGVILPSAYPHGIVSKSSWPNSEKRQIEAKLYDTCDGQFGVPKHLISFEACRLDNAAFSNSIFLPPKSDGTTFALYRWYPLTGQSKLKCSSPDYRTLFVTVTAEEGKSLEHCVGAWDLSECLLHALL